MKVDIYIVNLFLMMSGMLILLFTDSELIYTSTIACNLVLLALYAENDTLARIQDSLER